MLPWLVIGGVALLLGFVVRKPPITESATSSVTGQGNPVSPSSTILKPVLGSVPPLTYIPPVYTNRPTGPILGQKQTEGIVTGATQTQKDIGLAKMVVGAVQTAAQVAAQISTVVASTIGSYIPFVGAAIGLGFGAASSSSAQTDTQKDRANQQMASAIVGLIPGVGLASLATTIEGIAAAKHARQRVIDAQHEQAKSYADLGVWTPNAVKISDRLDEWYLLPQISEEAQIAWLIKANSDSLAMIDAFPGTVSVAMDHLRLGEQGRGASEGITLVAPRDVTQLERVFDQSQPDAFLLHLASADALSRKGKPYKVASFASGNYLIQQTAGFAGFPGMLPGNGIVPYGGNGNDPGIPAAPSLDALQRRMKPPVWLASFIQYWEAADLLRFHGSNLYARFVQSRVKDTLDEIAPQPPIVPAPNPTTVQNEIVAVVTNERARQATIQAQQQILTDQWFSTMSTP